MLNDAWTLARKDLCLFFRDKTALALALALPILLATIFGSAMGAMAGGGGGGGTTQIDLLVEDLDGSEASQALVARLEAVDALKVTAGSNGRREVANGEYPAAIVIPEGYGDTLAGGAIPKLSLLRDPSRTISQQVISGTLMPVLLESAVQDVGVGLMPNILDMLEFPESGRADAEDALQESWSKMDEVVARLTAEGAFGDEENESASEGPAAEEEESPSSGGFNFLEDVPAMLGVEAEDVVGADDDGMPRSWGASHAIAAMAVMMLMFSLVAAGGTLLEEQQEGTLLRLQLAPGAGGAILVGKLVSMGAVGLLQLGILYAYGGIVFDVPVLERPFELALTSLGVVFAATGLGMLFATVCSSRKQLEGLSTLVILVMSAVGGAWFPREVTPEWFRFAGQFTITAYAMDAFHGVLWYGKGLLPSGDVDGIWREVCVLYAIGVALTWLSFRFYSKRFLARA